VQGETIQWSRGVVFFFALVVSDVFASLAGSMQHGGIGNLGLACAQWLHVSASDLVAAGCALVAFRYLRSEVGAAALAAVGYAVIMYRDPVILLLNWLMSIQIVSRMSPLVTSWIRFASVCLMLAGLVLALRWLRWTWVALTVGAAAGDWALRVNLGVTRWLTRPDRSIPFNLDFGSEVISALFGLVAAGLFATFFWLGVDMVRTPRGRLSKSFYLGSIGGGVIVLAFSLLIAMALQGQLSSVAAFVLLLLDGLVFIYSVIVWLVLMYRMWAAIQDGHARTTPAKAVGLLFIPVYNVYWTLQVLWGFARDYNRYLERHGVQARKLPAWLFLVLIITSAVGGIPVAVFPLLFAVVATANIVMLLLVVSRVCDAVNALPAPGGASPPAPSVTAPSAAA
jgi:hypothetical protein